MFDFCKNRNNSYFAGLKSEMQVCNHRLKELAEDNRKDRNRLTNIQRNIALISNSRNSHENAVEEKMNLIEEYISNLTLKKRKFKALEKNIESSMERVQRKIENIKSKVLVSFFKLSANIIVTAKYLIYFFHSKGLLQLITTIFVWVVFCSVCHSLLITVNRHHKSSI